MIYPAKWSGALLTPSPLAQVAAVQRTWGEKNKQNSLLFDVSVIFSRCTHCNPCQSLRAYKYIFSARRKWAIKHAHQWAPVGTWMRHPLSKIKMLKISLLGGWGPWDNSMYCNYEGDVLRQSVMSHLNKCVSSGSASLAFSMYIHHINVTWQKHPICIADSLVGAKVCVTLWCVCACVCVGVCVCREKGRARQWQKQMKINRIRKREREDLKAVRVKPRPGGVFSYLHMQILVTPDPYPHQEKPIKTLFI